MFLLHEFPPLPSTPGWAVKAVPGTMWRTGAMAFQRRHKASGFTNGIWPILPRMRQSITGDPVMNNLLISSGSAPALSSGLTVNGNLLLEKDMGLNGQTVALGSAGYLVEGNGYFSGATGMITTTRALNNITAENVAGLGATLTSAANLGATTLTRKHTNQSSLPGGKSVLRSYDITPANNTGLNATLAYSYRDAELNDFGKANLGLYSSADGGNTFTCRGGVLDANNNKITLAGLDGFSTWTAGTNCYNPTNGGTIGNAQTICSGETPAELTQTAAPGGSPVVTLQYIWQASTTLWWSKHFSVP